MWRRTASQTATLSRWSIGLIGSIGLACLGTGCANSDTMKSEPAAKAWEDIKSNETKGRIGGSLLGGPLGGVIATNYAEADRDANQAAEQAMHSDLPAEALDAMVAEMAAYISEEVPKLPEVKAAKTQLVLAFGTFTDDTGNPQVKRVLQNLRGKLFHNAKMVDDFVFVASSESDAGALAAKLAGHDTSAFRDPLQRTADQTKPVTYDPASLYLITGQLATNKQEANHTVQITMTFDFTPVLARTVEVSKEFSRTYMWHPVRKSWELQQ